MLAKRPNSQAECPALAMQANACGLAPHSDMNPVLLKPQSETGAQVVVQGKVWGSARGAEYQAIKGQLMPAVLESYDRISATVDLMVSRMGPKCPNCNSDGALEPISSTKKSTVAATGIEIS